MGKPCIPLGHAEKFRKCIDAKLGSYACFPPVRIVTAMAASSGFSSSVVKVLVSFYRSREDSAFERHRAGSLLTFQSNPAWQPSRNI